MSCALQQPPCSHSTVLCSLLYARSAPSALHNSLLSRLWEISRPLTSTSLLTLVRALANRAPGGEHEQLRASLEGVARVFNLTMHLPAFSLVFLTAPAPQLVLDVAVFIAQVSAWKRGVLFTFLVLSCSSLCTRSRLVGSTRGRDTCGGRVASGMA